MIYEIKIDEIKIENIFIEKFSYEYGVYDNKFGITSRKQLAIHLKLKSSFNDDKNLEYLLEWSLKKNDEKNCKKLEFIMKTDEKVKKILFKDVYMLSLKNGYTMLDGEGYIEIELLQKINMNEEYKNIEYIK